MIGEHTVVNSNKEHKNKPSRGLTGKNIMGYALGDTGGVLAFGVIGSFLQMYYTDVLHISLGKIAVLMLVARIWDAINDPMMGVFIDSRKPTKHGKFRPYILWCSFPMTVAFILMFVKIPGLSENQYLIYAYVTYILYGMLYTGVNIPYGSLACAMTDDVRERSTLSVARSFGSGIGSLPGQVLLPLVVYSTVVDTGVKYLDGNKLLGAITILAGFMMIIYILSFKLTSENPKLYGNTQIETKGRVKGTLKTLLHNKPFIFLCIASMLLLTGAMYTQTINNYLFKDFYQKPQLFSLVTVANYIPMIILMPFMGKLVVKIGKKEICAFGSLFAALSFLVLYFLKTDNAYVFLGFCALSGVGIAFFTLEVWAMVIDVIDYQEFLSKRREEGTSFACFSFTRKIGQTLAGLAGTLVLYSIGYSTAKDVSVQAPEVIDGMYTIATLVPFAIYLAMFIILWKLYPLTKERVAQLGEDLSVQREQ